MEPDVIAVAVVVRERPGLVERDALLVLVVEPLEVDAEVLQEEPLLEDADAVDREGDGAVVVHPEVRRVEGETLPDEVGAALPVVPELLLLGGDHVEVLRNPDEDLAGRQELAARAA